MAKRITVVALVPSVVIAVTLIFFYFRHWREPRARYVGTDNPKLVQIRKDLNELKSDLRRKGLYACCIRNDCNWCVIFMGHCPCAQLVSEKGNEESCPECAAAWNKKQGKIPGVDPDAIKVTTFGVYGYEKKGGDPHKKGEKSHRHYEKEEEDAE